MTDTTGADLARTHVQGRGGLDRFFRATELDTRLLGMIAALAVIWIGFHVYGAIERGFGAFLTPRNLWNLSVQTASIGIMATGMVLVIVTRNIDLSVGSILALCAVTMGIVQTEWVPALLGPGHSLTWLVTILAGLAIGTAVGAFQGFLVSYGTIPSFIVTLGGLLVWRNIAYKFGRGETVPFTDPFYRSLGGGGMNGSIGAFWSWTLGLAACVGVAGLLYAARRRRIKFQFPTRPVWAEFVVGGLCCAAIVGAVLVVNAYHWPRGIVRRYARAEGITVPEGGLDISFGFAIPVLILAAVAIGVTFLSQRTRFGRYVYAIGGNPEAVELAGVNSRWVTTKVFALLGFLCGISSVVASARLGSATNFIGTLDELYVIAAAVIGGTSLAGGLGTIYGAIIGAVLMGSLQTGMMLLNYDAADQGIMVGSVLVLAVYIDILYRRRAK